MSKLKVDELQESTTDSNITVASGTNLVVTDSLTVGGAAPYTVGGTDVAVADGGTGAGTATAGFDALSPMTTVGDIMYGGSSGTVTRLAASTDGHVLTSTGAGSAPAWEAAAGGASDIDGLSDCLVENNSIYLGNDPSSTTSTAQNNVGVGTTVLDTITTGDENTCVGYRAGDGLTTGNKDLCLGAYTDVGENHASQTCISIGYNVSAPGDRVRIGVASKYINCLYGDEAVWTHSSDERIKRNIQDVNLGLSFINELRTVKYQWKPAEEIPDELGFWSYVRDENGVKTSEKELVIRDTDKVMHGLIAQEIKVALDNAGVDGENFAGWSENENGVQEISEAMFVYPLIKAIQELSAKVEALENA